jgi:phage host-nuclease inhibitor protein Gam
MNTTLMNPNTCAEQQDDHLEQTADGLVIDTTTGEIVGEHRPLDLYGQTAMDEELAEYVIGKIARSEAQIAAATYGQQQAERRMEELTAQALQQLRMTADWIEAEANARNATNVIRDAKRTYDYYNGTYLEQLKQFAKAKLGDGKARTLKLLSGKISLRSQPARLAVEDEALAVECLKEFGCREAIKESVLISKVPAEVKSLLMEKHAATGFKVVPASEDATVDTGIKAVAA